MLSQYISLLANSSVSSYRFGSCPSPQAQRELLTSCNYAYRCSINDWLTQEQVVLGGKVYPPQNASTFISNWIHPKGWYFFFHKSFSDKPRNTSPLLSVTAGVASSLSQSIYQAASYCGNLCTSYFLCLAVPPVLLVCVSPDNIAEHLAHERSSKNI